MFVAAGALAACAGEAAGVAAAFAVGFVGVLRAGSGFAGAFLFVVARAGAVAADCVGGRKLAVAAAALVRVVAHSSILVLARLRVAAFVVLAFLFSAAVAIFAFFDNPVPTLAWRDGRYTAVVREAGRVDAVATKPGTDIADRAGRKILGLIRGAGVHYVLSVGVARIGRHGAALR